MIRYGRRGGKRGAHADANRIQIQTIEPQASAARDGLEAKPHTFDAPGQHAAPEIQSQPSFPGIPMDGFEARAFQLQTPAAGEIHFGFGLENPISFIAFTQKPQLRTWVQKKDPGPSTTRTLGWTESQQQCAWRNMHRIHGRAHGQPVAGEGEQQGRIHSF